MPTQIRSRAEYWFILNFALARIIAGERNACFPYLKVHNVQMARLISRHESPKVESCEAWSEIGLASKCGLASAHAEAARQHAAAADAHALAAELHYEALAPDEDSDLASRQDALCASADALTQTDTASEASDLSDADFMAIREVQREANHASRLAEDGEDPRTAHAQAAKRHASLAEKHARSVQAIAPRSQEAHDAAFDADVASTRARDAELAEQDV